jgi:hypothetical protein
MNSFVLYIEVLSCKLVSTYYHICYMYEAPITYIDNIQCIGKIVSFTFVTYYII